MAVNLFTNGAGGNTWNTAGNWSLGTIPTVSDGHVTTFDNTSPNCTMGAARSCNAINFNGGTGYTNKLTISTFQLTVAGNVELGASMGISGTGTLAASKSGGGSCTLTSNGFTWPNNFSVGGSGGGTWTVTLVGDFTVTGVVSQGGSHAIVWNKTTSEKLYANGGLTVSINSATGNLDFVLGGGNWTMTATNGWPYNTELAGNITIGTNIYFRTGTLLWSSGTIDTTTNSSTLNLTATCTLDTDGVTWYNVTANSTGGTTFTINSDFDISNTFTIVAAGSGYIFAGTAGWTCGTLSCLAAAAQSITLKESITYTITTLLSCYLSRTGSVVLFTSSHASTKANLVLVNGAECKCLASFTRIDASGGRTIRTFNGVLTSTENIVSITDLQTVGSSF